MSRRAHEYLLSLGSNIEPERWVPHAGALVRARLDLVTASGLYDTPPVGGPVDQPPFINQALRVRTDCPARALREVCRRIEEVCGRERTADRFGPRTLDLDVVYGPSDAEGLPHDDLLRYAHVLVPCAEVWPDAVEPASGRTLRVLAEEHHAGWGERHRREAT